MLRSMGKTGKRRHRGGNPVGKGSVEVRRGVKVEGRGLTQPRRGGRRNVLLRIPHG